jgi:hypothetical protein
MDFVDEGISWIPKGTPWAPKNRWSHLPEGSRTMLGLVTYYMATGDERAKKTMGEMVARHYDLACKNEKYFWFVDMNYEEVDGKLMPRRILSGETLDETNPMSGLRSTTMGDYNRPATSTGMFFLPMMRFYEATGDERAAELVRKASQLIVDKMPDFAEQINHTHFNMATVSGILKCGALMNIPEFIQWGEKVYQQFIAKDYIPDFGWTPETATRPRKKDSLGCEACGTTDYIEVAILLAQYLNDKYWDDVERIGMNQLLEGQMLRIDFQERMPPQPNFFFSEKKKFDQKEKKRNLFLSIAPLGQMDAKMSTTECVLERCLGGFAGWGGPNDFIQMSANPGLMQCCFGSGARSLYDLWYFTAQEENEKVQVNMMFSKRLPSATIISYMPGKPCLEITMEKPAKLLVRKPNWVDVLQTQVFVNNQIFHPRVEGHYFNFGLLPAETSVRIDFPDKTTTKREKIGETEITTIWRGNAVIDIYPPGEIYPLYQNRNRVDAVVPYKNSAFIPLHPI